MSKEAFNVFSKKLGKLVVNYIEQNPEMGWSDSVALLANMLINLIKDCDAATDIKTNIYLQIVNKISAEITSESNKNEAH